MRVMTTRDLEQTFPMGAEVRVTWRGQPARGRVRRVDAERKNRDGTVGAVLVRVGDGHCQTALFFPSGEVEVL